MTGTVPMLQLLNKYYIQPSIDYQVWIMANMIRPYYPGMMLQGWLQYHLV